MHSLFNPRRKPNRTLIIVTGLLLLAAWLHITSLTHQLPYRFNPDEPNIWRYVNHLRTTGSFFNFYPPLRLLELSLTFSLLDVVSPGGAASQGVQFFIGRVSTAFYTLILLSLTYRAGVALHSRAAGVGALIFLVAQPQMRELSKVFKVDNFAWVFGMLCLLLTFSAIRKGDRRLLIAAFVAGLAGAASKYTMSVVLLVPVLMLITWAPKKTWLRLALVGAAVLVGIAGVVWLLNPPTFLQPLLFGERHLAQLYDRNRVFQFISLSESWEGLLRQTQNGLYLIVLGLIPLTYVIWRGTDRHLSGWQWGQIGVLLTTAAAMLLALGLFQTNRPQDRYLVVLIVALLWGLSLALLMRRQAGLAALAGLLLVGPWIVDNIQYNQSITRPDTRAMTAEWFMENVPSGTKIAAEVDFVEFDRSYGGFPGQQIYFLEDIESIYDKDFEAYRTSGTDYLIADIRSQRRGGFFDPSVDNTELLENTETVLDLSEPWNEGWDGPARYVFRVPPLQQEWMHVFLGDAVVFKGYDLPQHTIAPGDTLNLTLYWAAQRETDASYTVFAQVLSEDGDLIAQRDALPEGGLRPTYEWFPGYFDWDEWPIDIPADAPPGEYRLIVGMYDSDTLERLPAFDADDQPVGDSVDLGMIIVE